VWSSLIRIHKDNSQINATQEDQSKVEAHDEDVELLKEISKVISVQHEQFHRDLELKLQKLVSNAIKNHSKKKHKDSSKEHQPNSNDNASEVSPLFQL